jgi:transcriptional regulator with XRE-family HTH domain
MPSDVVILRNRMTHAELRERYGGSSREAAVRYEQELARLFVASGWSLAELAEKEGVSKSRIGSMITFGRFLDFASATTASESENSLETLSERRFRTLYQRTDHSEVNERIRFRAVLELLANRDQS